MMNHAGSTDLILGLGISGLSMARWIAHDKGGKHVLAADTRPAPPNLAALQAEVPAARFVHAPLNAALLDGVSRVLVSPGIAPADIAPLLGAAQSAGIEVLGELDLFAEALAALRVERGYEPKVIAVTGTNGKTTVTSLTARLLEHAGVDVAVAGNIGPALMDVLAERMARDALPAMWVLELSSFQLHRHGMGKGAFEPTAGAVLNLSQDHLDWHGDMGTYAAAKANVFASGGAMVLNRDDALVMSMHPVEAPLRSSPKSRGPLLREVVTFGGSAPTRPGDFGLEVGAGVTWLTRALPADDAQRHRKGASAENELHLQRLMPADALRIRGRHNAVNALAALALASAAGAPLAPMLYALREYRGEPHRLESIGVINGVEYFDDSKGTNVGATVAALAGLGAERRLVPILGGEGKGQDFAPLAAPLARFARAAILIGRDAPLIRAAIASAEVPIIDAADMQDAVDIACANAQPGDAVLLSPACASFDMFRDYAHRAQVFSEAVRRLAHAGGTELEGSA